MPGTEMWGSWDWPVDQLTCQIKYILSKIYLQQHITIMSNLVSHPRKLFIKLWQNQNWFFFICSCISNYFHLGARLKWTTFCIHFWLERPCRCPAHVWPQSDWAHTHKTMTSQKRWTGFWSPASQVRKFINANPVVRYLQSWDKVFKVLRP